MCECAVSERFVNYTNTVRPQGSAFRCLKTGEPTDAVLDRAARESGVPIADILENLPAELAVWVDPGEVSYRIGEKGAVKVRTHNSYTNPGPVHRSHSLN